MTHQLKKEDKVTLATVRLPHRSTHAIGKSVLEQAPRDSDSHRRKGKLAAGAKGVQALQFRSVLVPLDGSKAAEHALPWALDIASRAGGYLRLVHVHSAPQANGKRWPILGWGAYGNGEKKLHHEYVAGVAERISRTSSVPVAPLLIEGSEVAQAIADAARSADIVVMATRRRGLMGRLFCGSVVTQLLHRTTVPLLIAPGYNFPVERAKSKSIERILIPLDGSDESETILDAAAELSSLTGAERTLIRVVPRLPYAGVPWTEKEDEALSYLNRVAVKLRSKPSAVHTEIVSSDEAVGEVLLANAQASRIDLIAVTSRRDTGPWERFFRSPVNYLLGRSHVPVLVARAMPRRTKQGSFNVVHELHKLLEAETGMARILDEE
jgi:nucleotide-binding universal stress UspA family protein